MSISRCWPLDMDVVRIFLVGRNAVRAEQFALHHFREAEDGVERGAQFVAHGGEKARLGEVGALGPPPRLVGIEPRLFELGDERVLLRLERDVACGSRVQALDDDEEIADDADRQRRHRQSRLVEARCVKEDHADDHRQHARDEGGRNGRRQQRHHRRDEQHDQNGEGLCVRLARTQKRDDQIGPGRAAKGGREHELAPPRPGVLLGVDAVEESDRQARRRARSRRR